MNERKPGVSFEEAKQAVRILIDNAAKYMREGDEILSREGIGTRIRIVL